MKFLKIVLLILCVISIGFGAKINKIPRIIGGENASAENFPWHVSIFSIVGTSSTLCGGSLISTEWVLTSASCVHGAESFKLGMGSVFLTAPQVTMIATESIQHMNFSINTLANDIAVIQLPTTIILNENIQPIKLPSRDYIDTTFDGEIGVFSGFGMTNVSSPELSFLLQWLPLRVYSNEECIEHFGPFLITPTILCAGGLTVDQDLCHGDFGGAISVLDENSVPMQIGLNSFISLGGCVGASPNGFTRITSFLDWIQNVTGIVI